MIYKGVQFALIEQDMKQCQLANKMNIPASSLSQKLNGRVKLSIDECVNMSEILNTSLEDLFLRR